LFRAREGTVEQAVLSRRSQFYTVGVAAQSTVTLGAAQQKKTAGELTVIQFRLIHPDQPD